MMLITLWGSSFSDGSVSVHTGPTDAGTPLHTKCGKPGFGRKTQSDVVPRRQLTDYPQLFTHPLLRTLFCLAFTSSSLIDLVDFRGFEPAEISGAGESG